MLCRLSPGLKPHDMWLVWSPLPNIVLAQALLVAAIFFTLGVINLQQTTLVIRDKRRKTAKRRALSSRAKRHAS